MKRTLVATATYNEAGNIKRLIADIRKYSPDADVLVIDDASPDGTGALLDGIAGSFSGLKVLHRPGKLGLGSAHKLAMKYASAYGYDHLITMDADFSHNPSYIPQIIGLLSENDFVTGSRYTKGGRSDYGLYRMIISHTANILARSLLGIPLKECTTSFRGFRTSLLSEIDIDSIRSEGYSFFFESIFYVARATKKISEFPIYFENRASGVSKISKTEIIKSVYNLVRLFVSRLAFMRRKTQGTGYVPDSSPCAYCGSRLSTLLYPAVKKAARTSSAFMCTSMSHGSHGRIVRCLQCGLVRVDPIPDEKELIALYSEVEDAVYVKNVRLREDTFRHNLAKIKRFLPENGTLLDVGANCGIFLKVAADAGYSAQGIEPSKWCSDYARRELGQKVTTGTLDDLDPGAKDFDIVAMWDVFEHLADPMSEIRKINGRMRQGGILAMSTLDIDSILPKILGSRWPWIMDMHLYYYDHNMIKKMLEREGFELLLKIPYTHIISAEYLFLKLESMSIWGARTMSWMARRSFLRNARMGFRFGDVKMYVARKISS